MTWTCTRTERTSGPWPARGASAGAARSWFPPPERSFTFCLPCFFFFNWGRHPTQRSIAPPWLRTRRRGPAARPARTPVPAAAPATKGRRSVCAIWTARGARFRHLARVRAAPHAMRCARCLPPPPPPAPAHPLPWSRPLVWAGLLMRARLGRPCPLARVALMVHRDHLPRRHRWQCGVARHRGRHRRRERHVCGWLWQERQHYAHALVPYLGHMVVREQSLRPYVPVGPSSQLATLRNADRGCAQRVVVGHGWSQS